MIQAFDRRKTLGCIADPPNAFAWPMHMLCGASPLPLPEASALPLDPPVSDQGPTQSCVGQAIARAISIRSAIMGCAVSPSAFGLYALARAMLRTEPAWPLEDHGTMPSAAYLAAQTWGLPAETDWPSDWTRVNDEPTLGRMLASDAVRLAGWYRCAGPDDVRRAISQGYPVTAGLWASNEICDNRGEPIETHGPVGIGGHYVTIEAYDGLRGGSFEIANSWGKYWGFGGKAWCSEQFISQCYSVYAVDLKTSL